MLIGNNLKSLLLLNKLIAHILTLFFNLALQLVPEKSAAKAMLSFRNLCMDLERAYDMIDRYAIWQIQSLHGVGVKMVKAVQRSCM